MLWTGIVIGTIMFLAFAGHRLKLPWWGKLLTLWNPLLTDISATVCVFFLCAGVSSSITGLTAGLWCGLMFSGALLIGEKHLRTLAILERRRGQNPKSKETPQTA